MIKHPKILKGALLVMGIVALALWLTVIARTWS